MSHLRSQHTATHGNIPQHSCSRGTRAMPPRSGVTGHGSKPLTWNKISKISHWQKCFSELKISNPRISCTLNGVRRSSWKVVWVTKWSYASETSVRWQIFCSCSWRAIDTCKQEKSNYNLWLDTFYLWANFSGIAFWYTVLRHSSMHSIVGRQLRE